MTTLAPDPNTLPIVDLRKAQDPSQRLAVARQLVHALERVGFLFVDNVEGYDSERLLENTRWFFSLNQREKHRLARKLWNAESRNYYRGKCTVQLSRTKIYFLFFLRLETRRRHRPSHCSVGSVNAEIEVSYAENPEFLLFKSRVDQKKKKKKDKNLKQS